LVDKLGIVIKSWENGKQCLNIFQTYGHVAIWLSGISEHLDYAQMRKLRE
jgi:hypothetical protein